MFKEQAELRDELINTLIEAGKASAPSQDLFSEEEQLSQLGAKLA